jgi:hypothetical protein
LSPGSKPIEDSEVRSFIDQILKTLDIDNIDNFEYSTYENTWRNWIASSSYNKIRGLDNFEHSAYLSGSTNAFPEFISRYPGRRIRVSKSDFILTKIVSKGQQREFLPLEEDVLGNNDCVILSHPFSGNGKTLPDHQALLDVADKLNVPVMIDACYFTVGHGIDYDLTHTSIKEINFSLSKNYSLTNFRTGIRFTKEFIDDSIGATVKMGIFNKLAAMIGYQLLNQFSHDWFIEKYIPVYDQICAELNLEKTNTLSFAIAPDSWEEYKRGDYVRVCIAEELSRQTRLPSLV